SPTSWPPLPYWRAMVMTGSIETPPCIKILTIFVALHNNLYTFSRLIIPPFCRNVNRESPQSCAFFSFPLYLPYSGTEIPSLSPGLHTGRVHYKQKNSGGDPPPKEDRRYVPFAGGRRRGQDPHAHPQVRGIRGPHGHRGGERHGGRGALSERP